MSIILQSTVGGVSAEFIRRLPSVERAMILHGLEPSQFVISKDIATTPTARLFGPFFYDYTQCFSATIISPSPSRTTSASWITFMRAALLRMKICRRNTRGRA